MAITQVMYTVVETIPGGVLPIIRPSLSTSETLTPSGSNQSTTATAGAGQTICRITTDTNIYVEVGASPDATSDAGGRALVMAGQTEYFAVSLGHKAAVVTA